MSDQVRVGVIGTSGFTDFVHLTDLKSHPGACVTAICGRRDRKRAAELVATHDIPHIYLTASQNRDLFRRVQAALKPGGLLLDVPMPGEQLSEWTEIASLLLWVDNGGGAHSFEAYREWLEEMGFAHVRQLSERRLTTVK
jgi:hypothetical protein